MSTITDNAVPATGRTTSDEMIAFVIMAVLLVSVPLTGLYPYFVMQALCFALFACAFNLLIGYSGLLSFGHAMFLGTVFGPVVGAFVIIAMQQYLAGFGQWVTVIQGAIFVICVLTFRRGIIGEIAHFFKRSL